MTSKAVYLNKLWTRDDYSISTSPSLIPISKLVEVFASDEFYWAKPLPEKEMKLMVESSLCFGLYQNASMSAEQKIDTANAGFHGFARCVTDFVTFVYVTDVWIDPAVQGRGLGKWLVRCVQEVVDSMPHLRRALLFTGDWERSVPFYEQLMGMCLIQTTPGQGLAVMESKGRGHPSYGLVGNSYR